MRTEKKPKNRPVAPVAGATSFITGDRKSVKGLLWVSLDGLTSRVFPITKAKPVVVWTTTENQYD